MALFRTYPVPASVRDRAADPAAIAFPLALAFDFDRGDVALDAGGRPYPLDGDAAYEQWARFALYTQRGSCLLYRRTFGLDRVGVLRAGDAPAQRATFERYARAALRDPRTARVTFAWAAPAGRVQVVTITITSVRARSFDVVREVPTDG